MPPEQPFGGQGLVIAARGVELHLDDALDMPVGGLECADVDAKTPRDGRTDLLGVELLPFDLAALENLSGEGLQDGFLPQVKSQCPELVKNFETPAGIVY
jgi:hypothetical protein